MSTQWADAVAPRRTARPARWGRIATVVVAALTSVGVAGGAADAATHAAAVKHTGVTWNTSGVTWNASGVTWNGSGVTWNASGVTWNGSGVTWNTSGVTWNGSGVTWNTSGVTWNARHNVVKSLRATRHILVRR